MTLTLFFSYSVSLRPCKFLSKLSTCLKVVVTIAKRTYSVRDPQYDRVFRIKTRACKCLLNLLIESLHRKIRRFRFATVLSQATIIRWFQPLKSQIFFVFEVHWIVTSFVVWLRACFVLSSVKLTAGRPVYCRVLTSYRLQSRPSWCSSNTASNALLLRPIFDWKA